jgi:hypothetical protein
MPLVGGRVTYGLERVLVDEKLRPKEVLKFGDRKYLITDHVRLRPGPAREVAIVRWIFPTVPGGEVQKNCRP